MAKRGAIELSLSGIVFLILAIVILSLGIFFIKGSFGKTQLKFEELVSREPEPTTPTASYPITLSRETIKTNAGNGEAIKISVFNPTNREWTFRDYIENNDSTLCGASDDTCYLNTTSTQGDVCNSDTNAILNDEDCKNLDKIHNPPDGDNKLNWSECEDEGNPGPNPQEICFISDIYCFEGSDPDCAPNEGVRLAIECSQELELKTQTNPKTIPSQSSVTFTALLQIKKGIPKKTYLCKISILGEGAEGITKDLLVEIT